VDGVLDLHTFSPREVTSVVEEYLMECRRLGISHARLIHGKGKGVQRRAVRGLLKRLDFVEDYRDAPGEAGGWGATLVTLKPG
jgi:DNA-nicking Smr family endonuclease